MTSEWLKGARLDEAIHSVTSYEKDPDTVVNDFVSHYFEKNKKITHKEIND